MAGIKFVTDEKGQKVAVQIDLKKLGDILLGNFIIYKREDYVK